MSNHESTVPMIDEKGNISPELFADAATQGIGEAAVGDLLEKQSLKDPDTHAQYEIALIFREIKDLESQLNAKRPGQRLKTPKKQLEAQCKQLKTEANKTIRAAMGVDEARFQNSDGHSRDMDYHYAVRDAEAAWRLWIRENCEEIIAKYEQTEQPQNLPFESGEQQAGEGERVFDARELAAGANLE